MRLVRTIAELRAGLAPARRDGTRVGLVPTMGAFHEGHLSLMRRARRECDVLVVSLFVNPTQFDERGDLAAYPCDEARDAELAAGEGVDLLFAPSPEEIYPDGFSTSVVVRGVSETLEGSHRGRGHFDGVATVVTKLLNIVSPEVAYFGQKDAQQAIVIRQLVRDLDIPVRIGVCPTVRESDGLAMSSRNVRLSASARVRAAALHRALEAMAAALGAGEADPSTVRAVGLQQLRLAAIEPEYLELVDPDTLVPLARLDRPALALLAARVDGVRLIDNELLPGPTGAARRASGNLDAVSANPDQEIPTCTARC